MTKTVHIPVNKFSVASVIREINKHIAGRNVESIFFNPISLLNGTLEIKTDDPQTIEIEKIVEKIVNAPEPIPGKGNGTSRYRGVYWDKEAQKWRAQLAYKGKRKMKRFETELEAAEQYDEWAREVLALGGKAYPNFTK